MLVNSCFVLRDSTPYSIISSNKQNTELLGPARVPPQYGINIQVGVLSSDFSSTNVSAGYRLKENGA